MASTEHPRSRYRVSASPTSKAFASCCACIMITRSLISYVCFQRRHCSSEEAMASSLSCLLEYFSSPTRVFVRYSARGLVRTEQSCLGKLFYKLIRCRTVELLACSRAFGSLHVFMFSLMLYWLDCLLRRYDEMKMLR